MTIVQLFLLFKGLVMPFTTQIVPERVRQQTDSFPVPPINHKTLFYLQRNLDLNSVIYEMNFDDNGKPNDLSPVNVSWLINKTGKRIPLSMAQRKWAYGVKSTVIVADNPLIKINIAAYKKVDIYLSYSSAAEKYVAIVYIDERSVVVKRVFVNITGGTSIRPKVAWIKLFGNDLNSGKAVEKKLAL
jgi:hypothetical protein